MSDKKDSRKNNTPDDDTKQSKIPLYISLAIIAALIGSYFIFSSYKEFIDTAWSTLTSGDRDKIESWVAQFGYWGPIFIILVMILQMFLFVLPSWGLMVVSVLAYGPFWGAVISITAVAVASTIGYIIGKYFSDLFIAKLIGRKTERKLELYLDEYGTKAVFLFRLAPMLSNDAISFVAGLGSMRYISFMMATLAGIIPLSVLIAIFGESADKLQQFLIWASAVSLVLFIVYVIWDRKKQKKLKQQQSD
ncbi:TVP38/TMEM64 family protein [Roseivirga sp. BDSF3-8]|uniref:TVP38/TMEM64 family protein n=1 Tax=Roseivirga sp. BDSF3-8 TaxID=3241598 RepID=UPI003532236C